jgi:hypothetical protein
MGPGFYLLGSLIGLLVGVLGVPFWLRRVPPGAAGFRTGATLRDESVWYDVNATLGRDYVVGGGLAVVIQLLCWMADAPREAAVAAGAGVLVIPVFVAAHGLWLTRGR